MNSRLIDPIRRNPRRGNMWRRGPTQKSMILIGPTSTQSSGIPRWKMTPRRAMEIRADQSV